MIVRQIPDRLNLPNGPAIADEIPNVPSRSITPHRNNIHVAILGLLTQ